MEFPFASQTTPAAYQALSSQRSIETIRFDWPSGALFWPPGSQYGITQQRFFGINN